MALVSQLLKCQPAVSLKHNILVHPNELHEVQVLLYSWKCTPKTFAVKRRSQFVVKPSPNIFLCSN